MRLDFAHQEIATLARFEVPKDVVLADELTRDPSGMVLERELATRTP